MLIYFRLNIKKFLGFHCEEYFVLYASVLHPRVVV